MILISGAGGYSLFTMSDAVWYALILGLSIVLAAFAFAAHGRYEILVVRNEPYRLDKLTGRVWRCQRTTDRGWYLITEKGMEADR